MGVFNFRYVRLFSLFYMCAWMGFFIVILEFALRTVIVRNRRFFGGR